VLALGPPHVKIHGVDGALIAESSEGVREILSLVRSALAR
jgi:hypothetical protein